MSMRPDELIYEMDEAMLKRQPARDVTAPATGARNALMRSIGVNPTKALQPFTRDDELEKDGCEMIKAAYVFLALLGCPADARDFVICLMGISRGSTERVIATDDQIGAHMGLSRQTVHLKRKSLVEWEGIEDFTIVEVYEREFNKETNKYKPTEYRVVFTEYTARFLRRARELSSWKRGARFAIEKAAEEGLKEIAKEVSDEIPNAQIAKRAKAMSNPDRPRDTMKAVKRLDEAIQGFDQNEARFFKSLERLCADALVCGIDPGDWWRKSEPIVRGIVKEKSQKPQ